MKTVELSIPSLGNLFQDYRKDIAGDSYTFGGAYQADKVKYLMLHHSVTPQTAKIDGNWKAECDRIARDHMSPNGNAWAGIGYRFVICSDGTVAYVGDLSHWGAAVKNHNEESISICLVGDFTRELPTDAQITSAHLLIKHFIEDMPQYPLIDSWDDLLGHKDAAAIYNEPAIATACPGLSWGGVMSNNNDMKWRIQTNTVYTPKEAQETQPAPTQPTGVDPKDKQIEDLKKEIESIKTVHSLELQDVVNKVARDLASVLANAINQHLANYNKKVEDQVQK